MAEAVERLFWSYLIPSAIRMFEIADGATGEDHRAIASWMLRVDHEGKNEWTFRDLSRKGPRTFRGKNVIEIRTALEPFDMGGWINYPEPDGAASRSGPSPRQ